MSQACERFFIQEACFYECDPNAGLYRKWNSSSVNHSDYNEWQMEGMPIKRSYCDAWYTACYNDYFCGSGSYLACNTEYWAKVNADKNSTVNMTVIIKKVGSEYPWTIIIILVVVAVLFVCIILYMISSERRGKPLFSIPLIDDEHNPKETEMCNSEK